jgi:transglutaminase-like putative cysteine protease
MHWLRIVHETIYRYKKAVHFGPHRLILRPREGHDLHVEEMQLEITPDFELEWSLDLFGNSVATVRFLQPADYLRICSEAVLQQTARFPAHSTTRVSFPIKFTEVESAVASAYLATTYPEDVEKVREWIAGHIDSAAIQNAEEIVALVARTIRNKITYRRRETRGVQTPAMTISAGSGSCRDLATLMLEALRALGLPARFASGYLDCSASQEGHASTHAWAEAYLPDIGWTGYDPMLGEETSERHIVAGVSNHPRGVMPITGTFFDNEGSFIEMNVKVQTERIKCAPSETARAG